MKHKTSKVYKILCAQTFLHSLYKLARKCSYLNNYSDIIYHIMDHLAYKHELN